MNIEQLNLQLIQEAQTANIRRYVVGAIVSQNEGKMLILQRPLDDFMGGIYELPSGKVEADESLSDALFREIHEETGLSVSKIDKYLGYFDYVSGSGKPTRQFNYTVTVDPPFDVKLQEHEAFSWISPEQIGEYPVTDNVKEGVVSKWHLR